MRSWCRPTEVGGRLSLSSYTPHSSMVWAVALGSPEARPVFSRRHSKHPKKHAAHRVRGPETTLTGDAFEGCAVLFETLPGRVHTDSLDADRRRSSDGVSKDPREVSCAHVHAFRKGVDREIMVRVLGCPRHEFVKAGGCARL